MSYFRPDDSEHLKYQSEYCFADLVLVQRRCHQWLTLNTIRMCFSGILLCMVFGIELSPLRAASSRVTNPPMQIAFVTEHSGASQIYLTDTVGNQQYLVDGYQPSWSNNGRNIAFIRGTPFDGYFDIYVVSLDERTLSQLTFNGVSSYPSWSPARDYLSFVTTTQEHRKQLMLFTMSTGSSRLLTNLGDTNSGFSWAPNARHIAFVSNLQEECNLYVVNVEDGSTELLSHQVDCMNTPSWSPDGTQLVFEVARGWNNQVCIVHVFNRGESCLTDINYGNGSPHWSPDGNRIVFTSLRDGNAEIYSMNSDGTDQTRMTNDKANDVMPRWSADGKYIVFVSDRLTTTHLYLIDLENQDIHRISNSDVWAMQPVWQPLPIEVF